MKRKNVYFVLLQSETKQKTFILFRFEAKRKKKIRKRNEAKRKLFGSETKRKYGVLISLWLDAKNLMQKEGKNIKKIV
jgi:hypothetical protein